MSLELFFFRTRKKSRKQNKQINIKLGLRECVINCDIQIIIRAAYTYLLVPVVSKTKTATKQPKTAKTSGHTRTHIYTQTNKNHLNVPPLLEVHILVFHSSEWVFMKWKRVAVDFSLSLFLFFWNMANSFYLWIFSSTLLLLLLFLCYNCFRSDAYLLDVKSPCLCVFCVVFDM